SADFAGRKGRTAGLLILGGPENHICDLTRLRGDDAAIFRESFGGFFPRFFLRFRCRSRRRTFRSRVFGRGCLFSGFLRGWRRRLLFGCLFIRIASIICDVKAGPFENETSPGAKEALHLSVSPLRQPAKFFWTFLKRFS